MRKLKKMPAIFLLPIIAREFFPEAEMSDNCLKLDCPICGGKHFVVNSKKCHYQCFSCGTLGRSPLEFLVMTKKMDRTEAFNFIQDRLDAIVLEEAEKDFIPPTTYESAMEMIKMLNPDGVPFSTSKDQYVAWERLRLFLELIFDKKESENIDCEVKSIEEEFLQWAEEYFSVSTTLNTEIGRRNMFDSFWNDIHRVQAISITSVFFRKNLEIYCEQKGYTLTSRKSNGKEYFTVRTSK